MNYNKFIYEKFVIEATAIDIAKRLALNKGLVISNIHYPLVIIMDNKNVQVDFHKMPFGEKPISINYDAEILKSEVNNTFFESSNLSVI